MSKYSCKCRCSRSCISIYIYRRFDPTATRISQRFHLPLILTPTNGCFNKFAALDGTHLNGFLAAGIDANHLFMGAFSTTSQTCKTTSLRGFDKGYYSSLLPTALYFWGIANFHRSIDKKAPPLLITWLQSIHVSPANIQCC